MAQVRIFGDNKITITRSAAKNYFAIIFFGGLILFLFYRLVVAKSSSDADTIVREHTDYSVVVIIFGIVIMLLRVMEFIIQKPFETIEIKENGLYLNDKFLFPVGEIVSMEFKYYSPWWTRGNFYKIFIYSKDKGEMVLEKEGEKTAREVLGHLHAMLQVPWIETI